MAVKEELLGTKEHHIDWDRVPQQSMQVIANIGGGRVLIANFICVLYPSYGNYRYVVEAGSQPYFALSVVPLWRSDGQRYLKPEYCEEL